MIQETDEIRSVVQELLERYKQEIEESGHDASGLLANSATYQCSFDGRYFDVYFILQDYWKYLENGAKPQGFYKQHFPPVDEIEKWVSVKRLIPSTTNGRIPSTRQMAYAIANSISKNGTKPTKLLQKTIDSSSDLIDALCDIITNQMEEEINEEIKL